MGSQSNSVSGSDSEAILLILVEYSLLEHLEIWNRRVFQEKNPKNTGIESRGMPSNYEDTGIKHDN